MSLKLLNGAGTDVNDPILKGLGMIWIISPESMDVSSVTNFWLDSSSGFPGTNSVTTTPVSSTIEKGTTGSYNDTLDQLTIGSTTGLGAGDWQYLSHASITDGIYEIATIVDGTKVTLVGDPFAGNGDKTNITYQVCWTWEGTAGTAPSILDGVSYYKSDVTDGLNPVQTEDTNYIKSPPSGSNYIAIDSKSYTGQITNDTSPSLSVLGGWSAQGGVSYVALSGTGAFWNVGLDDQTEKTIASATLIYLSAGDGAKTFSMIMKSKSGGAQNVTLACDITLDTQAPTIVHYIKGR